MQKDTATLGLIALLMTTCVGLVFLYVRLFERCGGS